MTLEAAKVTGIGTGGGKVYKNGIKMPAQTLGETLSDFINWIIQFKKPVVLIAHNAMFDARVFVNACVKTNMFDTMSAVIVGFVDTLKAMRKHFPGQKSYKQELLLKELLGYSYSAHDALEDCQSLMKLVNYACEKANMKLCDNVISFEFIRDNILYDRKAKENLCKLKPMLKKLIISKVMADKIAGS